MVTKASSPFAVHINVATRTAIIDAPRDLRPDGAGDMPGQPATERPIATVEAENQALRAENERLRRVLDSARHYAVITMNLDGRITGWNQGARLILGYGEAEILGRSGEILFPAEDRAAGAFVGELLRAREEGCAPNERWHLRRDGSRFWASGAMTPLHDADGKVAGFLNILRDNTRVRAEEERRALMLAEMGHRVKNALTTVQAVALETLRRAEVPADVQTAFTDRIVALAQSHDLLLGEHCDGVPLMRVIERAVLPYGGADRTVLSGAPVRLPANTVEMLSLAFHELATNAAKHGALSVPQGRVEVCWTTRRVQNGPHLLEIVWHEHDGPVVVPPASRGFGSRLLERGLPYEFDGAVTLHFRPEGLECRISLPVATNSGAL